MIDRRYLKVELFHDQDRTKRPRLNFTLSGFDFLNGDLKGCFVSPITGFLQPIPNSEEPEWQTLDTGRFRKNKLSDGTAIDSNTPGLDFVEFSPDAGMVGIKTVGTNATGAGYIFGAQPPNTGQNVQVYAYSNGTDQGGPLLEIFWANDQNLTGGGVGIEFTQDGKVLVYKDDKTKPVYRRPFEGGGYTPGSVVGGSYARPTDQYVLFRVEVDGRFLVITSSRGGVVRVPCFWAIDRYNDDGTLFHAAEPVLPAKPFGWYIPQGSATVISAPVVYGYTDPTALSELYQFAEVPTYIGPSGTDALTGRVLPYSPNVTVTLVKEDGVAGYDRNLTARFRAKVTFTGPAFVSGVVGSYPRIATKYAVPEGGPFDVSDFALSAPLELQDGPDGLSCGLVLALERPGEHPGDDPVPIPAPFVDEVELIPIRLSLIGNPDDEDPLPDFVLLDGVAESPQWMDAFTPGAQSVSLKVWDRMRLVREAKFRETVVFDGMPFCAPPGDADLDGLESFVALCLREGGIRDAELALLPRIENADGSLYAIEDTAGQRAGDWNFAGKPRQLVADVLEEGWEMVPQWAWGLKPTVDGLRAYAVDVQGDEAEKATFYRTPEDAATDDEYEESELGAWPLLYGIGHTRIKLPKEGNVVRVNGFDPGTGLGIQAFVKDDASADPEAPLTADKLGVPREVFVRKRALTTQAAVNALARSLSVAVSKRQYTEPWPAFLRALPDGSLLWRGDMALLKTAKRDGSDSKVRVSGWSCDLRDEAGGGLMDSEGRKAPVSIRLAQYSGGAIVGLGASSAWDIARLHRDRVNDGGSQYGVIDNNPSSMYQALRLLP